MTTVAAIIVAGGTGSRMGSSVPKQFLELGGRPLLAHTVSRFENCRLVDKVVLVLPREGFETYRERAAAWLTGEKPVVIVPGGGRRQDSTAEGLAALSPSFRGLVAVHDGARPLVETALIERVVESARRHGAALAGLPVQETLKQVDERGRVVATVERHRLYRAQTPQCFRYEILHDAMERAREEGFAATDEAVLVERLGVEVVLVPGSELNIKVTTPEDFALAEVYLRRLT